MRLETSFARTGRSCGRIAALTAALVLAAPSAFAATVKSVSMKEAGSATQVVIEGDAPLNYHDFTLESPDRIVVDCPGTQLAFSERSWSGRDGSSVKAVRATETGWGKEQGTRIVVDLSQRPGDGDLRRLHYGRAEGLGEADRRGYGEPYERGNGQKGQLHGFSETWWQASR